MQRLTESEVAAWVEHTLLAPTRSRPIVAVTSHAGSDRGWIDPDELQRDLGELAEVVFLETGDATWALSEALPPRLDVYGGAIRVWWPGLGRDANPLDHRLHFVHGMADAERVRHAIADAVRARASTADGAEARPEPARAPATPLSPELVRVTAMSTDEIVVASSARRGPLVESDLPIPFLIEQLSVGCQFPAMPLRQLGDGRWAFSNVGMLPDPWPRFVAAARVGQTFTCRVQNLNQDKRLVFVDVMPGVVGICLAFDLDPTPVDRLADFVQPGELLTFTLLVLDAAQRRLKLSRKKAYTETPLPLPPLFEGGQPFAWREGLPWFKQPSAGRGVRTTHGASTTPARETAEDASANDKVAALEDELQGARDERLALVAQIRQLREQVQEGKRAARSLEQRLELEQRRGGQDPLASERAFLEAVRVHFARQFGEDDRFDNPLQRMRVGREFLRSVAATPGIELDKVVDVCTQVAAGIAHKVPGRDAHPLREGSRGAGDHVRQRDGARAWRCALFQGPSAPRLHWWIVPGADGATIEFANVGLHDDFTIADA